MCNSNFFQRMVVGEVKRATQDGGLHFVMPDSDGVCMLCL